MTGFPQVPSSVTPQYIPVYSPWSVTLEANLIGNVTTSPATTTWVSGLAVYVPFVIPFEYVVQRVFWINGSVVTTTNVDCGIYTVDGTRLYSTTPTTQVGAISFQAVTLGTPLLLSPGRYYMAWTCDNTTNRANAQAVTAANGRQVGLLQQSSVATLPATATFAAYAGQGLPTVGMARV